MKEIGRKSRKKLAVICHNIRSAMNVGSVFRTADGAGMTKIYLTGYTPMPPHSGISKTALGAEKLVAWEKFPKLSHVIHRLKKEKYKIVALEQNKKSIPYYLYNPKTNVALILGNEVRGLNQAVLRKCDTVIDIPMRGGKESLNVSVAFGIAAYSMASKAKP